MLPPFIIEQIRQREEQERSRRVGNRARVELPIERRRRGPDQTSADEDDADRGVVIVDLMG